MADQLTDLEMLHELRRMNANFEKFFKMVGPGLEKHELIQSMKTEREQRLAAASRFNKEKPHDDRKS